MPRWIGFLGSWALFALGLGLASIAVAGEWINLKDTRRLKRYALVDTLLSERKSGTVAQLRLVKEKSGNSLDKIRSDVLKASSQIDAAQETPQIIMVSTLENRVYVRNKKNTIFKAVCSTGKNTTMIE